MAQIKKNARHLAGKMNLYLNGNKHPEFIEVKCSQQNNNYDCGAYTMLFAQISARKAITGERQENLTVDKSDVTELRERISNIILIETKSIDKTEKDERGMKYQKQKARGMKDNKSKDIREFIASLCVEKEISKNTKRDILKFYDEKNYQENEDQKNKKEPVQQKREIVCRNWAKDKCIENYNCLYKHPIKCEEIIRKGYCNNRQCQYYHPKICWDNLRMEKCKRGDRCIFRHVHDENVIYNEIGFRNWNSRKNYEKYYNHRGNHNQNWKGNNIENDFLWKNLHPQEKEDLIKIWSQMTGRPTRLRKMWTNPGKL